MIENKRIENLEFRQASYLLPEEEWPKHPSYHINYHYPNPYYGKENDYVKVDEVWFCNKDTPHFRIHKECFKNPESNFAIASFVYDRDGYYELRFIAKRPLDLNKEEREIFWELVEHGYNALDKENEDENN